MRPREIGIGIVGAGWMGQLHAASYKRVRDHYSDASGLPRLVAIADAVPERARDAAIRLGAETWTTDPMAVVGHAGVQALSIASTNDTHLPVALAAAEAGKHFWGEKPLGRFPEETAEIAAAVRAADVRTIVGFNYRHAPALVHARNLIEKGDLGDIRQYRGRFLVDYASNPRRALSWRFTREVAGLGVLGDLMSHVVDTALLLAGPISEVVARHRIEIPRRPRGAGGAVSQFSLATDDEQLVDVENEDSAVSLVRFASGAEGVLEVSRVTVGPHCQMSLDVHGSEGALSWDFQRMNELRLYMSSAVTGDAGYATIFAGPRHGDFVRFQPDAAVGMGYGDLKVIEAHLFLESVVDGVQRKPGASEALEVAKVLAAMRRSADSGAASLVAPVATGEQTATGRRTIT